MSPIFKSRTTHLLDALQRMADVGPPSKKIIQRGVEDINVCMYSVFLSILQRRHLWSISSSLLFTHSYDFPSVRYIIMHKIMMEKTRHQQPTLSVCQHSPLYQTFSDQKIYLSIQNGFFLPVSNFRKIVLPLNLLSERFFCTSLELALLFSIGILTQQFKVTSR